MKYAKTGPEEREPTSLILRKEGDSQGGKVVKYEDFIAEDMEAVIDRLSKPAPTFDQFLKELKEKADKEKDIKDTKEKPYH
jgi:hypothetical protein